MIVRLLDKLTTRVNRQGRIAAWCIAALSLCLAHLINLFLPTAPNIARSYQLAVTCAAFFGGRAVGFATALVWLVIRFTVYGNDARLRPASIGSLLYDFVTYALIVWILTSFGRSRRRAIEEAQESAEREQIDSALLTRAAREIRVARKRLQNNPHDTEE